MRFELFIAQRMKFGRTDNAGSPGLNVALTGMVLAIVVMILSIAIVMGFKSEITGKIYSLDSHLKVSNAALGLDDNYATVNGLELREAIMSNPEFMSRIQSMPLIADKPAILKTDSDFKGVEYHGVDKGFDWTYLNSRLVEGRVPSLADSANISEVIISQVVARSLHLKVGDKILTYFIDSKVKVRNSLIVGIFSTDFESFDNTMIVGNIALLQQVNDWDSDTGNYLGVNVYDTGGINEDAYTLFSLLAANSYDKHGNTLYNVTQTHSNNRAFFSWLKMLDMNVIVILVLMLVVAGFTLVSALLMIILERIRMIGTFKALGCDNGSIRRIFICLTQKLIVKALIIGNVVGIGLALIQQQFHIVKLNAEVYYMPYVPISINVVTLLLLNLGVLVVSYVALLGPSYVR